MSAKKIFISYKRQDRDVVFPIVDEIRKKTGVDCWIDLDGIESGDQFERVIIQALKACEIVVFMMSKNSIAPFVDPRTGEVDYTVSTWTEREVKFGLDRKKRVIPLSIDGTMVSDCDWLAFNCSGIDSIDYANPLQRDKFFRNMRSWLKVEEPTREVAAKSEDSKLEASKTVAAEEKKKLPIAKIGIAAGAVALVSIIGFALSGGEDNPKPKAEEQKVVEVAKQEPVVETEPLAAVQHADESKTETAAPVQPVAETKPAEQKTTDEKPLTQKPTERFTTVQKPTESKPAPSAKITVPDLSDKELVKIAGDYMNGANGKPKEPATAAVYLTKAATNGNAAAQNLLGVCYLSDTGVTKDYKQAFAWFKKSAEQGVAEAQMRVASCYSNGLGTQRDIAEAIKWYEKAAAQGEQAAIAQLEKLKKAQ